MSLRQNYSLFGRSICSLIFLASINAKITQAQVIPDNTLGSESSVISVIRSIDELRNRIEGGATRGKNLFHSFQDFSVGEGAEIYFTNPEGIANIFSRVTGNNISEILGTLGVEGSANLFFINPNGIVFGEKAFIDVSGSFIATTANEIEFADGKIFNIRDEKPLLTWNAPIGLGLYGNNSSITINGTGNQITSNSNLSSIKFRQTPSELSLKDGKNLALVGNGINFNGGVVATEGGDIYLTSVEAGSVDINQIGDELTLLNGDITKYQDINLAQQSLVHTNGEKIGTISLSGKNINISNGSFVLTRNQGDSSGGSINVKASESLNLFGASLDGNISTGIRSETSSIGKGADINISANQLTLQDQARIRTNSFKEAVSGSVNIYVSDTVELSNSSIGSGAFDKGNAGNLNLVTSKLLMSDVGSITSSTIGSGNGGEITIQAESIDISGTSDGSRSNISASTFSTGDNPGDAGKININTDILRVRDSASISSSSFGDGNSNSIVINAAESIEISGKDENFQGSNKPESIIRTAVQNSSPALQKLLGLPEVTTGDAGNLIINTPSLKVFEEGTISVENQGTGSAGTLSINADNLNLDQTGRITAAAESGIGGNIELNTQNLNITNDSQITASAGGNENGGNITINTTNLTAKKNNQITASAFEGEGGNLKISAESLSLNDRDSITAQSKAGEGGNITLGTRQLQLQKNSLISTSAEGFGDGGNITINSDIFTAFNNSQVTANAFQGSGGNILINTTGYFVSEDFIISATSEFGLDGTVEINAPDNDFQKDLELSQLEVVSLPDFFTPRCQNPDRARLNIGTGQYLPAQPNNYFSSKTRTLSAGFPPELEEKLNRFKRELESTETETEKTSNVFWKEGQPIVNSTKIVRTEDGRIFLVAPEATPANKTLACHR